MTDNPGRGGRFCHNCGTELSHSAANFCGNCGAAQDPAEAVEAGESFKVPNVPSVTVNVSQAQSQQQSQEQAGCGYGCAVIIAAFAILAVIGRLLESGSGGVVVLILILVGGALWWLQRRNPQFLRDSVASLRRMSGRSAEAPDHDPNYGTPPDPSRPEPRRPEDDGPLKED